MVKVPFWRAWPTSLRWAIGVSLGIHLLVILPLSIMFYTPIAMPQAPLSAVLKGPGEQALAAKQMAPRVAPLSAGDAAKNSKPKPRPVPLKEHALREQAQPTPATTVAGVAKGDASAQPNSASRATTLGGAPDTARDGVDPDALATYKIALGRAAGDAWKDPADVLSSRREKRKCYLVVNLFASGQQPTVELIRGTGFPTVDSESLRALRVAASKTRVPTELQGRDRKIPLEMNVDIR